MGKNPLISVITVCYNEEKSIGKTCKSVKDQTYKGFEWIVVDGASKDGTLKILKKYGKIIGALISETDKGIYNAMNKGIKKSKGEYLLFLNGGDFLKDKNVLKKVSEFIEKDKKESEIYYGDLIYGNGEKVTYKKSKLNKKFFVKGSISHQSAFIKKELFKKYGNYNESNKISSDYEFWIKTIVFGKTIVKYLPVVVSIFSLEGISTNYKLAKIQVNEKNKILRKYGLIGPVGAWKNIVKWNLLAFLKKIGLYNVLRKNYREVVKR